MDTYNENADALFEEVFEHLAQVTQDSTTAVKEDLFKRAERSLDSSTPRPLLWRLLQTGEPLLTTLSQDPRPLTRLLERVVQLIPFDELKTAISPTKLSDGLQSPSIPIQLLCLAYLTRAASTPSGAAWIAASSALVQLLVTVWLRIESTEVSERALECLVALLDVDSPDSTTVITATTDHRTGEAQGQGLVWRRLFHDPQVYVLFFRWTTLSPALSAHDLKSKTGQQQVTISQARLFDFLSRVAVLDWGHITTSSLPDVERVYLGLTSTGSNIPQQHQQSDGGLLRYAASNMIDRQDILMEVLRQDFFMKLSHIIQDEGADAGAGAARGATKRVPTAVLHVIEHEMGVDLADSSSQQHQQQQQQQGGSSAGGMHL